MSKQQIKFTFLQWEPSFSVIERLLNIGRERYESKFGGRILNYLIFPRMLSLYLAHLMPVHKRCELISFLHELQRKGAKQFKKKRSPASNQRLRYRFKRELVRKLARMKLERAREESSIIVSDEASEKMSQYLFADDRTVAYGIY